MEQDKSLESQEKFSGRAVYIYALDIAYELSLDGVERLLSSPLREYAIGPSKRNPKYYFFYRPKFARLGDETALLDGKTVQLQWEIKVFEIGAVSIEISLPFESLTLAQLTTYHDLVFDGGVRLESKVRQKVEAIMSELRGYCINPTYNIAQSEAYTVFCLTRLPGGQTSEQWLRTNKRQVAALLTEEANPEILSNQEAEETVSRYVSYYDKDLVVVDWDAALIIDEGESLDDVLHVVELANVQLAELSAYDRILDESLQKAYSDVKSGTGWLKKKARGRLREIRVDLTRVSDELTNITKFFGDWHLARVYGRLFECFHLPEWHKIVSEKLRTLGDLYGLLQQERNNFWMMILETTIVLLFILDLLLLLRGQ
jgi:hypothetical protein